MRKPTGQMQEETQETLDEYNELYNWEYNDMCDFIENYGETEFLTYYETYHRLVDDYGQNLIDEFAEQLAIDCGMVSTGISWVEIDWEKSWDNLSYDYTEIGTGFIFCDNY